MGVSSKSDFIHLLTVLTHKEDKISREDTICLNKVYYLENDLPQGSKFFFTPDRVWMFKKLSQASN